jgi:quercetin dioxygenase-like cupin family protein
VASTGDTLRILGGVNVVITRSTADTGGERVEMEFSLPPGSSGPPRHFHPGQEEEWHVLEGTLSAYLDDRWQSLEAGESVSIPRGRAHTFRNDTAEVVRVRDVHVPALGFQEYMETLDRLTETGKVKSLKSPASLIYLAMVLREHRGTQLTSSPVQRAAESFLARLGNLLGYET